MSQYKEAREKTIHKIEEAYFSMWIQNKKITVRDICEQAQIHRSTFYFYYEWVDDVLDGIKNRLMDLLLQILNGEHRKNKDYKQVMLDLRNMFAENRKYLIPLVLEQKGGDFAITYRECLKEEFAADIGLDYKTGNNVKNDVANCVLSGLIEMQLYELSSQIIPLEFTYLIGNGIINKGVNKTLNDDLNIKFGKNKFNPNHKQV